MKFTIKVLFGKENFDKFLLNQSFSIEEENTYIKEYSFKTKIELIAFKKGLDEAIGWLDCFIIEDCKTENFSPFILTSTEDKRGE